ncbi:MAG: adenylate cyclase [Cyanobacteria bacterium J069]|nr:MAG: adenylate cyclase [Cyanobacteria bacterium J069]
MPGALREALFPVDRLHPNLDYVTWRQGFMRRRLNLSLRLGILAYLTFILMRWILAWVNPGSVPASWFAMAGTALLGLVICLVLHRRDLGRRYPALIFLGCSWSITLVEQIWATLRGVAFPGVFAWTLVFLVQATLLPMRWPLHLISQVGLLGYYLVVNSLLGLGEAAGSMWDATLWLYLFWFCAICDLSVFLYERLQRAEFSARQALEAEQEKSERLLLNILPESVARQLKQDQRTIAEHFPEVTVLFADIVGFTELSAGVPPEDMVRLLNQVFSTFDHLAERHGLEKIKTIGDSYMVVGGLPVERADHLEAIANMALDMQRAIAQFQTPRQTPFNMRIGINTGPVVAGVIGVKKFIYDLWGDTVNTASRMESQGLPGMIQVTDAVYTRLQGRYEFKERGTIYVKGKGQMQTYLLLRRME